MPPRTKGPMVSGFEGLTLRRYPRRMPGWMTRPVRRLGEGIRRIARRRIHGALQEDADRRARESGVPVSGRPGTVHDAFSHAYVSARLTVRFGSAVAHLLGELNERLGSEAAGKYLEARMDRHNNAVGRAIGRAQRAGSDRSGEATARRVRAALDEGSLVVIDDEEEGGGPRVVPSGSHPALRSVGRT